MKMSKAINTRTQTILSNTANQSIKSDHLNKHNKHTTTTPNEYAIFIDGQNYTIELNSRIRVSNIACMCGFDGVWKQIGIWNEATYIYQFTRNVHIFLSPVIVFTIHRWCSYVALICAFRAYVTQHIGIGLCTNARVYLIWPIWPLCAHCVASEIK